MSELMLLQGSARALPLADESVQMCVTSPPYWGLRAYAGEQREVWDGDPDHAHKWAAYERQAERYTGKRKWQHIGVEAQTQGVKVRDVDPNAWGHPQVAEESFCACGAWYGALGLEPTPELYVEHMVEVFREARRVLRSDGTLWLNLGDSYAANWASMRSEGGGGFKDVPRERKKYSPPGLKPKDLVGIPWMVAFALRADGWYLRSDIIWHKPNPMPESVTDRPTKSHEYLFLLSKSERYYYDAEAVREAAVSGTDLGLLRGLGAGLDDGVAWHAESIAKRQKAGVDSRTAGNGHRNKRTVWTIPTRPYAGAHFATFPEQLVEPCILAGSRTGDVVLDPFNGSGTTGRVAIRHGRSYVGIDISREYLVEQSRQRIDRIQRVLL